MEFPFGNNTFITLLVTWTSTCPLITASSTSSPRSNPVEVMVLCWFVDETGEDSRKCVDLNELEQRTGVLYHKVDPNNYREQINHLSSIRKYSWEDTIELNPKTLENYEAKIKMFGTEHWHVDEEVRCVLRGKGYFDVRDKDDKWIRIQVEVGDLLILPGGIYHRFFFDDPEIGIYFLRLFEESGPYRINFREKTPRPAELRPMARQTHEPRPIQLVS